MRIKEKSNSLNPRFIVRRRRTPIAIGEIPIQKLSASHSIEIPKQ